VSNRATGACREIVPFELNWLTWIVGWPTEVSGYKAKVSDLECDIDDIYQVLLKYNNKMLGHLQVDVLARTPTRAFRLLGSEGSIEWNVIEKSLKVYRSSTREIENITEDQLTVEVGYTQMSPEQMYINEIQAFLQAVAGKGNYSHSFKDDLRILKILNKIEQSSDEGLHIVLENENLCCEVKGEVYG
jgi:predicted dehydrogenase